MTRWVGSPTSCFPWAAQTHPQGSHCFCKGHTKENITAEWLPLITHVCSVYPVGIANHSHSGNAKLWLIAFFFLVPDGPDQSICSVRPCGIGKDLGRSHSSLCCPSLYKDIGQQQERLFNIFSAPLTEIDGFLCAGDGVGGVPHRKQLRNIWGGHSMACQHLGCGVTRACRQLHR